MAEKHAPSSGPYKAAADACVEGPPVFGPRVKFPGSASGLARSVLPLAAIKGAD